MEYCQSDRQMRGMAIPPPTSAGSRPGLKAQGDAFGSVSFFARDLLPVGTGLVRSLPGGRQGAGGIGGGRPAYPEPRDLAGYPKPPDLGHQRLRPNVAPPSYQPPASPSHARA